MQSERAGQSKKVGLVIVVSFILIFLGGPTQNRIRPDSTGCGLQDKKTKDKIKKQAFIFYKSSITVLVDLVVHPSSPASIEVSKHYPMFEHLNLGFTKSGQFVFIHRVLSLFKKKEN